MHHTHRSGGNRGACVDTLRGTKGADFEAPGQVRREAVGVSCGCFGRGKSDDFKDRYIVIKGQFCFIFKSEDASSPSYAIRLHKLTADHEKGSKTVHLTNQTDVDYVMTLHDADKAAELATVVRRMAAAAETEQVRKELGHEHLLNTRSSMRFAEAIAVQKTKDQPDAPVTMKEVLSNMDTVQHPL